MRLLPAIGALILSLFPAAIRAQEPALPAAESQDPQTTASDRTSDSKPAAPQLIPLTPGVPANPPSPILPTIPQLDEVFTKRPLTVAAETSRHHLEWRELRNRVAVDPEVKQALAIAEAARTDIEKRRLLGKYYELYFGRMINLAPTPELKAFLNTRKSEQLATLPQPRVRPTPIGAKPEG